MPASTTKNQGNLNYFLKSMQPGFFSVTQSAVHSQIEISKFLMRDCCCLSRNHTLMDKFREMRQATVIISLSLSPVILNALYFVYSNNSQNYFLNQI